MLTTIRKILETKRISIYNTIYSRAADIVMDTPINIGDFFALSNNYSGASDFKVLNDLYRLTEEKKQGSEYLAICLELNQVTRRLRAMKDVEDVDPQQIEEKSALRNSKKELSRIKELLEGNYLAESMEETRQDSEFGLNYLMFKNFLSCSYFSEAAALLPQIKDVDVPKLKKMPLFVRGIYSLAEALRDNKPLGITGGPCLFGTHEVTIDIRHKDGSTVQFDFSNGREYDKSNMLSEVTLESYCKDRYMDIVGLELTNFKTGVTGQEYLSIQCLFEFARVLNARIVIPIPDMSYMKFFKGATKSLAEEVKEPAFKVFEKISYDITDMYLGVIDDLRLKYPEIECQVVHSRDPDLCDLFYASRQQYVEKLLRLGSVTGYEGKLDAVVDYITMVALPYYVFGTKNVLQLDSVDEADSMRKCMKVHGGDVVFHSILFPEYMSGDGVNTVFNAPLEFKDYLTSGGKDGVDNKVMELV